MQLETLPQAVVPRADLTALRRLVMQVSPRVAEDAEFDAKTRFVTDLGMKSLELVGLVFGCEHAFGVSLISHPGLISRLQTAGEAIEAITALQDGRELPQEEPNAVVSA